MDCIPVMRRTVQESNRRRCRLWRMVGRSSDALVTAPHHLSQAAGADGLAPSDEELRGADLACVISCKPPNQDLPCAPIHLDLVACLDSVRRAFDRDDRGNAELATNDRGVG